MWCHTGILKLDSGIFCRLWGYNSVSMSNGQSGFTMAKCIVMRQNWWIHNTALWFYSGDVELLYCGYLMECFDVTMKNCDGPLQFLWENVLLWYCNDIFRCYNVTLECHNSYSDCTSMHYEVELNTVMKQ